MGLPDGCNNTIGREDLPRTDHWRFCYQHRIVDCYFTTMVVIGIKEYEDANFVEYSP